MSTLAHTLGLFAFILFALSILSGVTVSVFGRMGHVVMALFAFLALSAAIIADSERLDALSAAAFSVLALHLALALGIWERNRWRP